MGGRAGPVSEVVDLLSPLQPVLRGRGGRKMAYRPGASSHHAYDSDPPEENLAAVGMN